MSVDGTKKRKVRPYNTRDRIFPAVTTNLEEFKKYCKIKYEVPTFIKGYYFEGVIWIRNVCSPYVLIHELGHHIFHSIGNHNGGTRLFFDFINVFYEKICGFIRHKTWRNRKFFWTQIECIHEAWNDFLDWQLCRDVDE
jgi:hypothetical protein